MLNGISRKNGNISAAWMGATALATVLCSLALGGGMDGAQAHAQMSEREIAAATRAYEIPAGRMSTALNQLADKSGVQVVYDTGLTRSLKTGGLSGSHTLNEALEKLLSGSGLNYELSADGKSALIVLAQAGATQNDASGATQLPPIEIGAANPALAAPPSQASDSQGSSQSGAGLGGRFTGYSVNPETPSLATKDNIPLMQTPGNVQVVTRQAME